MGHGCRRGRLLDIYARNLRVHDETYNYFHKKTLNLEKFFYSKIENQQSLRVSFSNGKSISVFLFLSFLMKID